MSLDYLLLIDGSSLLTTQYYGNLPREVLFSKTEEERKKYYHKIMQTKTGIYTNAIYGFMRTLLKIIKDQKPKYLAVAWDKSRNTFRREIYSEYKGNRGETPKPLKDQFILCETLLDTMNIKQFMDDRFEADDFCGSLSKKFESEIPVRILTKDNDYLQLVTEKTNLWMMHSTASKTEELYKKYGIKQDGSVPERAFQFNPELVKKEFGVEPSSINSLKGLQGDPSDNIKGVPGIGPATAVALIAKYKNVSALYDDIRDLSEKEQKEKAAVWKQELGITRSPFGPLLKKSSDELLGEEAAFISEKLATIKCDIQMTDVTLESLELNIDVNKARAEFLKFEFNSLKIEDSSEEVKTTRKDTEVIDDFSAFMSFVDKVIKTASKESITGVSVCFDDSKRNTCLNAGKILAAAFSYEEKNYYVPAQGFITGEIIGDGLNRIIDSGAALSVMDVKTLMKILNRDSYGNCFDVSLASYLLNPLFGNMNIRMRR